MIVFHSNHLTPIWPSHQSEVGSCVLSVVPLWLPGFKSGCVSFAVMYSLLLYDLQSTFYVSITNKSVHIQLQLKLLKTGKLVKHREVRLDVPEV